MDLIKLAYADEDENSLDHSSFVHHIASSKVVSIDKIPSSVVLSQTQNNVFWKDTPGRSQSFRDQQTSIPKPSEKRFSQTTNLSSQRSLKPSSKLHSFNLYDRDDNDVWYTPKPSSTIIDTYSQVRVKKSSVTIQFKESKSVEAGLKDRNVGMQYISLGSFPIWYKTKVKHETKFWVSGVVVDKTSKIVDENQNFILNICDLRDLDRTYGVILQDNAIEAFSVTPVGVLVDVITPNVMQGEVSGIINFLVTNASQVSHVAEAKDFGNCKHKGENGTNCLAVVNTRDCSFCTYHAPFEFKAVKCGTGGSNDVNNKHAASFFGKKNISPVQPKLGTGHNSDSVKPLNQHETRFKKSDDLLLKKRVCLNDNTCDVFQIKELLPAKMSRTKLKKIGISRQNIQKSSPQKEIHPKKNAPESLMLTQNEPISSLCDIKTNPSQGKIEFEFEFQDFPNSDNYDDDVNQHKLWSRDSIGQADIKPTNECIKTTAVMCRPCKYVAESQTEFCKDQLHLIRLVRARKQMFTCKNCGNQVMSFNHLQRQRKRIQ